MSTPTYRRASAPASAPAAAATAYVDLTGTDAFSDNEIDPITPMMATYLWVEVTNIMIPDQMFVNQLKSLIKYIFEKNRDFNFHTRQNIFTAHGKEILRELLYPDRDMGNWETSNGAISEYLEYLGQLGSTYRVLDIESCPNILRSDQFHRMLTLQVVAYATFAFMGGAPAPSLDGYRRHVTCMLAVMHMEPRDVRVLVDHYLYKAEELNQSIDFAPILGYGLRLPDYHAREFCYPHHSRMISANTELVREFLSSDFGTMAYMGFLKLRENDLYAETRQTEAQEKDADDDRMRDHFVYRRHNYYVKQEIYRGEINKIRKASASRTRRLVTSYFDTYVRDIRSNLRAVMDIANMDQSEEDNERLYDVPYYGTVIDVDIDLNEEEVDSEPEY